jgi:hypothetical protein
VDTREKIVPLEELRRRMAGGEWRAIAGLFDPLTAALAQRLTEIGNDGELAAIVLDEPGTLLTAEARAALIAGLRPIRLVSIARRGDWQQAVGPAKVFEDATRSDEFVQFVLERQGLLDRQSQG